MPLKVIGAGLPRTGTWALKLALEELGVAPCCHLFLMPERLDLAALWMRVFAGETGLWDRIFDGFTATADAPSYLAYQDLAAYYPDAKVILTVRDAERWVDSLLATAAARAQMGERPRQARAFMRAMQDWAENRGSAFIEPQTDAQTQECAALIAAFHQHNDEVCGAIPAGRRLIFDVDEGWRPLCTFLDLPVPDTPFPNGGALGDLSRALGSPSLLHELKAGDGGLDEEILGALDLDDLDLDDLSADDLEDLLKDDPDNDEGER